MQDAAARWLLTGEAERVVSDCAGQRATPALVARLRGLLGGDEAAAHRAAAALELADLRRRAAAKFTRPDRMFFTRKALEQATDEWIARYKAQRFAPYQTVADVCCGVGGDLIGLSSGAGAVTGFDGDALLGEYAERNAVVYDVGRSVATQCAYVSAPPEADAWHADPDRRPAGRRTTQPDMHEPSLETLGAWRAKRPHAAIKLAPAARLPDSWQAEAELEWVSRSGECRQLVAWCGDLAREAGQGRATRVEAATESDFHAVTFSGPREAPTPQAHALGDWLHEPDPAVLAARLQGALAESLGLGAVAPGIAYFTSDRSIDHPLLARFRVQESMPLDRKRLAGWLRERGFGRLEIKCRGVELRPEALRRELKPKGDQQATLLLYPDASQRVQAVVAERCAR